MTNKLKLIVGLGNPGKEYASTRHNVGWLVLDLLAEGENWKQNKKANALYLKKQIDEETVELLKPLTFMNNSGQSVAYAMKNHNLTPNDVMLVYDDIDLPIGTIRIGKFESAGGHKGVQSVIDHLKSNDFLRFRVGIKNDKAERQPAEKFVLQKFGLLEKKKINNSIQQTSEAIKKSLKAPIEEVMNEFN